MCFDNFKIHCLDMLTILIVHIYNIRVISVFIVLSISVVFIALVKHLCGISKSTIECILKILREFTAFYLLFFFFV